MQADRENRRFLPGVTLSDNLAPFRRSGIGRGRQGSGPGGDAFPCHPPDDRACSHAIGPDTVVVSASKGIENRTHLTMSGVLAQVIPGLSTDRLAVLTGPSFAKEVARQVATVVTVASSDADTAAFVQQVFATDFFGFTPSMT
jgi:glycerol-3-phosphate dehydrogenase (NAD(P)+)